MEHLITEIKRKSFEQLKESTVEAAKRSLLDTLGVIIKGSSYPNMLPLESIVNKVDTGSYAFGFGNLETSDTALYNGTASHSVELDDFFREGSVHAGVVVVPTALSIGQEINASGSEIIKSIIIGYEVMARVGMSAKGSIYNRGFHPTSICGVYGSAATAAYLYKLSEYETQMALGIAGNQSFGLMAYKSNGAWTKRLNAGWAAKIGIMATKLAKAGFIGPDNIIEDRFGFKSAFVEEFHSEYISEKAMDSYVIDNVSFKPYSSCRFTHSPIDGFLEIMKTHFININDIEEIVVETHKTAIDATMNPEERKYKPLTTVDAQFSIPFCLGLASKYGNVMPEMFEKSKLEDEDVLELAKKVKGYEEQKYTELFPKQNACKVVIKTKYDIYRKEVMNSKGDPENQLSNNELEEKFSNLTRDFLTYEQQKRTISTIWSIDSIDNINDLLEITKLGKQEAI